MTHSTHEKSMQDILEKLRDPSNNDPAALYTQIEKLRALLADALSKIGDTSDEPGCGCPDVYDLRLDCPIHGTEALATSRGFTYWPGGDAEPADWDGGDVLLRDGGICAGKLVTDWGPIPIAPLIKIIGYHRKAEASGQIEQAIDDAIKDGVLDDMENSALKAMLSSHRRAQRDAFAMAAAPFILGKFFGAVDYGDLVVHLFDFADTCLSESEKRAKGDAA